MAKMMKASSNLKSTMPTMKTPSMTAQPAVYGHNTSQKLGKPQSMGGSGLPTVFEDRAIGARRMGKKGR